MKQEVIGQWCCKYVTLVSSILFVVIQRAQNECQEATASLEEMLEEEEK